MDITYHGIKQLVLTVEVFKLFNYLATLTLLHFLLLLSKSIKKNVRIYRHRSCRSRTARFRIF